MDDVQRLLQPEYKNGAPNPARRILGGIIARGPIERDICVNLIALRRLGGKTSEQTSSIRRYIPALTLLVRLLISTPPSGKDAC